jgi:hypothetical protein
VALLGKSCSRFNELGLNIPLRLPYGYLTVRVNHKVTIRVMHILLVGCPNLGRRRQCHPKQCHPISKIPETVSPDLENLGNVHPPPQITRQVVFPCADADIMANPTLHEVQTLSPYGKETCALCAVKIGFTLAPWQARQVPHKRHPARRLTRSHQTLQSTPCAAAANHPNPPVHPDRPEFADPAEHDRRCRGP